MSSLRVEGYYGSGEGAGTGADERETQQELMTDVIRLLQIDGKIPNIALMRLAAHHRRLGDEVIFHHADSLQSVKSWWFGRNDKIYASAIFSRSMPVVKELLSGRPDAIVGGTGSDAPPLRISSLEAHGVKTLDQDYSIYPKFNKSIGFTQRGCRLKCSFCVVPQKEGRIRPEHTIYDIWRGSPWPRELLLLDNDFFGQPEWKQRIKEIREGGFKVSFNQGINARCLTDEAAEAIASVKYYDDDMRARRIYTAWDNKGDEERLFLGLNRLVKYGVKPDHIMVYMLIGYWPGETAEDREYRRMKLREFGARPFPMAYITSDTPPETALELRGFQRWVIRRADIGKNKCSWQEFTSAKYRPENIGMRTKIGSALPQTLPEAKWNGNRRTRTMSDLFSALDGEIDYGCGAELSPDGVYRYTLTREWDDGRCVAWLMFNPSTADASQDDATIRKCVGFSRHWGYGRMIVVNLFAIRNRDPKAVARVFDPIGPLNDYWIKRATEESREVICAWGCSQHIPPKFAGRINNVTDLIPAHTPTMCLGRRNDGSPRHPLMLPYSTERIPYHREKTAQWCPTCVPEGTCPKHGTKIGSVLPQTLPEAN